MLTKSHFCSCSNSPDFCGQESMQMFCSTCDGDSHHCSNLHQHYQYFSSQTLPKLTGIVPHDLKENSLPLPFQIYTNLLKNCCSLTKVLRVLATKCFMDSILAGMYSSSPDISLKLSQVTVLLQPGMMHRLRQFKPSKANLKDAFFKLVRSSQAYFKPSSKYFLPIVLENGLTVASLCYEEKTAEQVLGVRYLPLVSSSDRHLI